MALPTTPPIRTAIKHHNCPPFKSSGGAFYAIGIRDGGFPEQLAAYKTTDPTVDANWTEQDAAGRPNVTDSIEALAAVQAGDVIHIVTQNEIRVSGMNNFLDVHYHQFNMATDNWDVAAEVVDTAQQPQQPSASIAVKNAGADIVVAYQGTDAVSMGANYLRPVYNRRSSGTWQGATAFGAPSAGAVHQRCDQAVLGASDRIHFLFTEHDPAALTYANAHQSLNSSNALDTYTRYHAHSTSAAFGHGVPVAWADGGTIRIRAPRRLTGSSGGMIKFDSGADPTITSEVAHDNIILGTGAPGMGPAHGVALYDADVDTRHLIYLSSALDLFRDASAAGDGNWGTDVTLVTVDADRLSATIYQRGTDIVLAFLRDPVSTALEYDEVVLRTAGTSLSVPGVALTATAAAPTVQAGATTVAVPNVLISALAIAPTRLAEKNLAVANASITTLALTPTVTAGNADVAVPNIPITATSLVPTVQGGAISVTVPNIALAAPAAAPSVFAETTLAITTALLEALTTNPGVVTGGSAVAVPNVSVSAVAAAPAVFGETTLIVPNALLEVTALVPTVVQTGGGETLTVPLITITATALAPTPQAGATTLAVPLITITAVAQAPNAFAEVTVTVPNALLQALAQAPTLQAGAAAILVPTIGLLAAALAPNVQGGAASIVVPNIALLAAALTQTLQPGQASIPVPNIALLAAALSPTVFGETSLSVPNAALLALALAPTVDTAGEQTLLVPNIGLLAAALAPTPLAGGIALSVPNAALSAIAQSPTVRALTQLGVPNISILALAAAPTVIPGAVALAVPNAVINAIAQLPSVLALTQLGVPAIALELTALAPTLLPGGTVLSVPNISIFVVVGPVDLEGGFEPAAGGSYIALGDGRVFRVVASSRACHVQAPYRFFHDLAMDKSQ